MMEKEWTRLFAVKAQLPRYQQDIHIGHSFEVHAAYERLRIELCYSPFQEEAHTDYVDKALAEGAAKLLGQRERPCIEALEGRAYPTRNIMTVAVKAPDGWRGEDHKFLPERTIYLGPRETTPCFIQRGNPAGRYEVLLHIYAVVSETVSYELRVYGQ